MILTTPAISIAEEIDFLSELSGEKPGAFKHLLVAAKFPDVGGAEVVVTFVPPQNSCWLVTRTNFRSIPAPDDASLSVMDFRSEDVDYEGNATARWLINGLPVTPETSPYFAALNHDEILVFQGGTTVTLVIERVAPLVPPTQNFEVCVHGYLMSGGGCDPFAPIQTNTDVPPGLPPAPIIGFVVILG